MEFEGSSIKILVNLSTNACSGWSDVFKNENDLEAW